MDLRTSRSWPVLPQLRRRWFLRALCAGGLLGWLAQLDAVAGSSPAKRPAKAVPHPAMPPALALFIDHLIPADEFTPAASALRGPQAVWQRAQQEPPFRQLIEWT